MSGHLGERLTALVDGELPHAERERVLVHLAHCTPCRHEVEAHRRLKASLLELRAAPASAPPDLASRLLAVAAAGEPRTPARPPATPRSARGPRGVLRPSSRALRRPRRAATAGVLLVAGLAGALVLGAPASSGPTAPVDPSSPALIADHVSTTSEVPLLEPAYATVVPAGTGR